MPPARCRLLDGPSGEPLADCSLEAPLVMDRFELTRRDLVHYRGDRPRRPDALRWNPDVVGSEPEKLDWPAFLDYFEAEELARERGMRLPTAREWVHVAVGRRRLRYPWGSQAGRFANTIDIQLNRPTPVGTFENGLVRPFGCYDMLGNVWEWCSEPVPSYRSRRELDDIPLEGSADLSAPDPPRTRTEILQRKLELARLQGRTSVLGGGYDSPLDATYVGRGLGFYARLVDKRTLNPAIGARMCADADTYLWEQADGWGTGDEARRRVTAVARRWAEDSVARVALRALLDELRARPGAPEGLDWLAAGVEGIE